MRPVHNEPYSSELTAAVRDTIASPPQKQQRRESQQPRRNTRHPSPELQCDQRQTDDTTSRLEGVCRDDNDEYASFDNLQRQQVELSYRFTTDSQKPEGDDSQYSITRFLIGEALNSIPADESAPYATALYRDSVVVALESEPLWFVPSAYLDPASAAWVAARRIVAYWKRRVEIFGSEIAFKRLEPAPNDGSSIFRLLGTVHEEEQVVFVDATANVRTREVWKLAFRSLTPGLPLRLAVFVGVLVEGESARVLGAIPDILHLLPVSVQRIVVGGVIPSQFQDLERHRALISEVRHCFGRGELARHVHVHLSFTKGELARVFEIMVGLNVDAAFCPH